MQRPQIFTLNILNIILVKILPRVVFLFYSKSENRWGKLKCQESAGLEVTEVTHASSIWVNTLPCRPQQRHTGGGQYISYTDAESPRNAKVWRVFFANRYMICFKKNFIKNVWSNFRHLKTWILSLTQFVYVVKI